MWEKISFQKNTFYTFSPNNISTCSSYITILFTYPTSTPSNTFIVPLSLNSGKKDIWSFFGEKKNSFFFHFSPFFFHFSPFLLKSIWSIYSPYPILHWHPSTIYTLVDNLLSFMIPYFCSFLFFLFILGS